MIVPTTAPATAPDRDTVCARYPSHAASTLTHSTHGAAATTALRAADTAAASIRHATHSTPPAVAGTVMLSSSRTGTVSANAAATAATSGATIVNAIGGGGATAGRVHHASATPAIPPKTTNASVPAIVLSGFHGRCPRLTAELAERAEKRVSAFSAISAVGRDARPTSVAAPSPNARIPHAAATMSRRDGKMRMSSRTASG